MCIFPRENKRKMLLSYHYNLMCRLWHSLHHLTWRSSSPPNIPPDCIGVSTSLCEFKREKHPESLPFCLVKIDLMSFPKRRTVLSLRRARKKFLCFLPPKKKKQLKCNLPEVTVKRQVSRTFPAGLSTSQVYTADTCADCTVSLQPVGYKSSTTSWLGPGSMGPSPSRNQW